MDNNKRIAMLDSLFSEYIVLCRINGVRNTFIEKKEEQIKELFGTMDESWLDLFGDMKLQAKLKLIDNPTFVESLDDVLYELIKQYFRGIDKRCEAFFEKKDYWNSRNCFDSTFDAEFNKLISAASKQFISIDGSTKSCLDVGYSRLTSSNLTEKRKKIKEEKDRELEEYKRKEEEKKAREQSKENKGVFFFVLSIALAILWLLSVINDWGCSLFLFICAIVSFITSVIIYNYNS